MRRTTPKLPLPVVVSGPHLIQGSLGPRESVPQTASRSVQPFLYTAQERDQQTDRQTDTQTDRATPSAAIGRIWLLLRCGLKRPSGNLLQTHKSLHSLTTAIKALHVSNRHVALWSIYRHTLAGYGPLGDGKVRRGVSYERTCWMHKIINTVWCCS